MVIDIVETVPVDVLRAVPVVEPGFPGSLVLRIVLPAVVRVFHPEVAREIAVVVRPRVVCIIPVHCRIAVLACPVEKSGGSLEILERGGGIFQDKHRLMCLAHTGIAELPALISPVGIVHIVSDKVINLLCGSILGASLARSGECHETQAVNVPEFFLHSGIICERPVIDTFHPVISSETGRHIESI